MKFEKAFVAETWKLGKGVLHVGRCHHLLRTSRVEITWKEPWTQPQIGYVSMVLSM
jgi:hypothetical protein